MTAVLAAIGALLVAARRVCLLLVAMGTAVPTAGAGDGRKRWMGDAGVPWFVSII